MKRRLLVMLLACACIVGCRGSSALTPSPVSGLPVTQVAPGAQHGVSPDTNVNELPEPPVVKAVHGVATVQLIANINPATGLPAFQYNGLHGVAPTIELQPGQKFVIDLQNELLPAGKADLMNLHFHGLGSAPKRPGDDVMGVESKPGQTLHYEVTIPRNQPPGLYWYHPHIHGETSYQVGEGGMSGAILVEGLEKHFPALAKMKQRIIIVRATGVGINAQPHNDDGMDGMPMPSGTTRPLNSNTHPCSFNDHLTVTLNGAYHPVITIAPGEKQFFRLINATGHKPLDLNVQGGTIQVVSIDGFALDTYPGTGPTETVTNLLVPVAGRAEFIVTGSRAGRTRFRTLCYNTGPDGDPDVAVFLAHMQSAAHGGTHGGYFSNQPLAIGAPLPQNVYTQKLPPPVTQRLVVFSEDQKPHFFLNGKSFHMNSPPMFVVHTGTTELWHLRNVTQEDHDFHIHQLHFLVLRKNGIKLAHPYWADSVQLPHRYLVGTKVVDGSMDVLMNFMDPIIKGEFLFHCHIMDHEDEGMMAKIEAI